MLWFFNALTFCTVVSTTTTGKNSTLIYPPYNGETDSTPEHKIKYDDDINIGPSDFPPEDIDILWQKDLVADTDDNINNVGDDNFLPDVDDANDDVIVYKADDVKENPHEITDIGKINEKDEKKHGGVIRNKKEPGSHVDQEDIMFGECEEEEVFGTGGNMPNRKCDKKLRKKLKQKDATILAGKLWSLPIHFKVDDSLGDEARRAIQEAMQEYQAKTCIRFLPKKPHNKDYMLFFYGKGLEEGCWSAVGKDGSQHRISLSTGCETKSTAVHEIMHALGFWHEQSRSDRDQNVQINWDNIEKKQKHNFKKALAHEITDYGYGYDFHSIMHYKRTAFGKRVCIGGEWQNYNGYKYCVGGKEILLETITPRIKTTLGQCDSCGLSQTDALQLNERYCSRHSAAIQYHTLSQEISTWMNIFTGVPGDQFRGILLRHVYKIHPFYFFTVASFESPSRSPSYSYVGYCSQATKGERNEVVCFANKEAKFTSKKNENLIVNFIVTKIKMKGCDINTFVDFVYKQVSVYGFPVAMVFMSKAGNTVRAAWIGTHTYFRNYECLKDQWVSLVIMFGSG